MLLGALDMQLDDDLRRRAPERPQSGQLVRGGAEHPRLTRKSAGQTAIRRSVYQLSSSPSRINLHPTDCLHPSPPAPSAHTSQSVAHIAHPQARTPTTPHRIQARTQHHAPEKKTPPTPRALAQKRIRAPKRSRKVSCGIFSSAGASDAAPSRPSLFTASIAARPSSTHLAIRRPHRPLASVVPQPHHIASKRVPNTTH